MVYKKYIKRGGKLFGPYYYRSVKKDGKVITQYVKNPGDFPRKKFLVSSKKNFNKFLIFPIIFLILILGFFLIKPVFTGKVIMSVENAGVSGETLSGNLALNLEPNEFIPASTKVLINNNGEKYEFILSNLIKESPESGEFYVSGADVSGVGEGYGVKGEELEVSFSMKILSESKINKEQEIQEENNTAINENQTEIINEIEIAEIQEEIIETEISSIEETQIENEIIEEISSEPSEDTAAETEITGGAILNFFNNLFLTITGKTSLETIDEVSAKVSKDKPFIYFLEEGQTAEITNSNKKVNLEITNNSAVVSTEYSGENIEYLINLSELNIPVRDKNFEIKLIYNETEIYSQKLNLGTLNNPVKAKTGNFSINLSESQITAQNVSEISSQIDNSTIQYGAILGEPVKWKKKITASEQNTIVELPVQAENISVYKIETPNAVEPIQENLSSLTTGNLILEYNSDRKGFFSKIAKFITGRAIEVTEKSEKIEINISENGAEFEIKYITPAPISFEKNTSVGKEVIISSEVHYENILAYTTLPENTNLEEIKLYQITDGLRVPVDFVAYNENDEVVESNNDLDDDVLEEIEKIVNLNNETAENKSLIYGKESEDKLSYSVKKIRAQKDEPVSRIEWIVPSLSNQTYELILISKAQHLDSNKNFISDIYEQVKSLDGNWSEQINDSEYVRVTFEKNLTNENDITIYPRTINGTPRIEVYENNKTELIAEFTNITDNQYNKVYLTNLGKGNSYDNETEILTENGWKYFYELNGEKVAALNQETNKLEWQLPSKKHSFDYDGEMYKIFLEDGSELLVSPQHKVYSGQNLLINSFGERTFEGNNPLSILSPEKMGQSNLSASAKYGTSLRCLDSNSSALGKNSENSDLWIKFICSNINFKVLSNISLDNPDILNILSLCFSNSVSKNSGATKSNLLNKELEANTSKGLPLFNKDERITLTSTTNSILNHSKYLFDNASFILLENSSTSSSVNLELDKPLFNIAISSSLDLTNLLNNIGQSTFGTCLINSNSSGISNRISAIDSNKNSGYLNLSESISKEKNKDAASAAPKAMQILTDYDSFNEKKEKGSNRMVEPNLLTADNNECNDLKYLNISVDNDNLINKEKGSKNVTQMVSNSLQRYNNYKDNNYLNVFVYDNNVGSAVVTGMVSELPDKQYLSPERSLGSIPSHSAPTLSQNDFLLQPITEVYNSIKNGNEIYFLNSNNEPVKVNSISKEKYNGKIYDVDVENNIILVKRKNSVAVWSGNSESYSQNVFDLKILGGSVEFDYIVDPIILGNANSVNTNTTYENNFTHLNISNSSIVAYYPFDDNVSATTAYDYTNNSNDGTISGAVYNTSQAIYGGAMTFDGKDDYVSLGTQDIIPDLATQVSWSAWIKTSSTATQFVLGRYNGGNDAITPGLFIASGKFDFYIDDTGVGGWNHRVSSTSVNNGNWHHIVGVFNGSTNLDVYVDGALNNGALTGSIMSSLPANTVDNRMGAIAVGSSYFNGSIDEVMIWNTALNSTEVLAIYNNQTARFHGTGEMNYTGVNFAGNDTINITLAGCQQNMGTSLRAKVNNGAYVNFDSNCFIKDYNATGNLNSANVTVGFVSDANRFYTPLVIGNITLDSRDLIVPNLTINLPSNNTFTSVTNLSVNFTAQSQDLSTCWYSNDSYTANTTLTNCNTNITTVQWAEGQHNVTIWVNDTANSVNSSMVSFTIDTTFPTLIFANPTTNATNLSQNFIIANLSFTETNLNVTNISLYNSTQNIINSTSTSVATGGTITYSGGYTIHTFTSNGTFTPSGNMNVEYLVVAGGGGAGVRGGGGAGGMLNSTSFSVSAQAYPIIVGVGGAGATSSSVRGNDGAYSNFSSITATGGGGGGSINNDATTRSGRNGGSGGGAATSLAGTISGTAGSGTAGQGNNGGTATINAAPYSGGGGGSNGTGAINGVGGNGTANNINGSLVAYAGGGAGYIGVAGTGGGGASATAGKANTGGGGGGGSSSGAAGGSGIVIIRYLTSPYINFTGLADGTYYLNATIGDTSGNKNQTETRNILLDTTFPTWSANKTNLTSSTLNGKGVYFNITLTEINPNTYIFSWYNGTAWENTTSSYINNQEVSISKTINVDIATINWTWYINDSANNLNQTDIWSVTLLADDNVPPNISFANPTTNATNLSQNFIFANLSFADATSSISMANISLFNSTQNIINSTQGTTSTLEINFTGLSDGTYYLNASVNDTLGNRNQTETRKIILDATAPNLTINSPTATTYTISTILFNATSIDLTTLVDSCWYTTNSGTTNRTLSKDGTTNFYNFTQTSFADSTYTARFYCNDSANNVNNSQTIAFTIDTSVPSPGGGPAPVSGGGGAPSKPSLKRIFNLEYNMYDQTISLKQVEFDRLQITNNGEAADEYSIEVRTIDNIISFEEKKIKLAPGETKDIEFKISSPKEPGIYTGKIIVSNGVSEREVLVAINVKTEKSLFDITLTIPNSLKTLLVGQNLVSKIELIQMGLKENIDVTLNYVIKDFDGQTYLSESETIAVLDQKSYEKEFFTGELSPGQYVLGTELIHPDGVAAASTHFVVQERGVKFGKEEILLTALISVLILISLIIFLSIRKYKRVGKALKTGRK